MSSPEIWQRVRAVCWPLIAMTIFYTAGCSSSAPEAKLPPLQVDVTFDSTPPVIGDNEIHIALRNADGTPVDPTEVRVEGNMNHAGMKPSFAETARVSTGQFTGKLDFTMGGDWFLLIDVIMPDGSMSQYRVDVPGVRSH